MKVRADEHVAAAIVAAIREIALSDGYELTSVVESGFKSASDVHWITAFAQEGGDAILSADTDFLKEAPQVVAIDRAGLRVIHLPAVWANAQLASQAGHLIAWWRRIEEQLAAMKPRECYAPRFSISEDAKLVKIPLEFQKAHKKLKKAK